jgi:hypothetical protein
MKISSNTQGSQNMGTRHALRRQACKLCFLRSTLSTMLCYGDNIEAKELGFEREEGSTLKCVIVIEQRVCELWQRWRVTAMLSLSLHALLFGTMSPSRLAIAS